MVNASLKLTHHLQDESILQSYLNPSLSIFRLFCNEQSHLLRGSMRSTEKRKPIPCSNVSTVSNFGFPFAERAL